VESLRKTESDRKHGDYGQLQEQWEKNAIIKYHSGGFLLAE